MNKVLEKILVKIKFELDSITDDSSYNSDEEAIKRANELFDFYCKVKNEMED